MRVPSYIRFHDITGEWFIEQYFPCKISGSEIPFVPACWHWLVILYIYEDLLLKYRADISICLTELKDPRSFVNETNLVHSLFLVYLSISTCFERLWVHNQEKQLCFCDNWYLLFCVDDCLLCRVCRVDHCLVCRVCVIHTE
jgi:hypothetical protein